MDDRREIEKEQQRIKEHLALHGLDLNLLKSKMLKVNENKPTIFNKYDIANSNQMTSRYKYLGTEISNSDEVDILNSILTRYIEDAKQMS